ncbi:hypothetical protein K439DRAFT_1616926 [Ramaria rubella]|nr:hypothetical protein K439DRAFT_1616926 [Ramaria rubella]
MLHVFNSGEWGKHQGPLTLEILSPADQTHLAKNMRQMPRWRGLKHFNAVSTTDFADSNSYRDILKPCTLHTHMCMSTGLCAVTELQIQYISECLAKYEQYCAHVTKEYGKNYNYPKHHGLTHLAEDLRRKGAMENYTTRPGKGFQQEVQDTEQQMVHIDKNQEVMARIRTAIDLHDKRLQQASAAENATDDGEPPPEPEHSGQHWALGARQKKVYAHQITPYQCIYLNYRSLEDWTVKQDILRCNPCFHDLINTEPMTFGRLQFVFSCEDSSGKRSDLALIRILHPSAWIPTTKWEGCTVVEEKNYRFVMLKYLLRGCHMIPTFEKKVGRYYLNDLVDGDAFLRFFFK